MFNELPAGTPVCDILGWRGEIVGYGTRWGQRWPLVRWEHSEHAGPTHPELLVFPAESVPGGGEARRAT